MSYEKQNWKNGDVITESKLNHMEDGIATGGGVLVTGTTMHAGVPVLTNTWQEIHDATLTVKKQGVPSGTGFSISLCDSAYSIVNPQTQVTSYIVTFNFGDELWGAETADGYPVYREG